MRKMIRNTGAVGVMFLMAGCVLSPGMNTIDLQRQDGVVIESAKGEKKVQVQAIDASLIVKMHEAASKSSDEETLTSVSAVTENPWDVTSDQQSKDANDLSDYVYKVGPADILSIIVWDHPELTIPAGAERSAEQAGTVVENDGTIYFPYAGVVPVAGLTIPQIRRVLTEKLGDVIEEVKLDVRMAEYNSKRVYVVGEVRNPSVQRISNIPPTIVEMINAAGGFNENADTQLVTLTRDGQTFRVDLLALYEEGDEEQNMLLEPGDVVNVWDRSLNKVYVLGEVTEPGSYFVNKGRKTLAEALSDAGGVNPNTSDPGQVFVFRQSSAGDAGGQPEIYHLNASSPDALLLADQFPLQSRDLVYVEAANVVRWSRVIQNISGTMTTLNAASQTNFPLFKGER